MFAQTGTNLAFKGTVVRGMCLGDDEGPGGLLQGEPHLQSDLIALDLAVLDRTAHLRDFEPAKISLMFQRPC
jgi:hypothetical protein